jgi:hypothetical protein
MAMPTSLTALLVLVYAAIPGYAFWRVVERGRPRDRKSRTREVIEVVAAGILASTIAALIVLVVAEFTDALVPIRGAFDGWPYLRTHQQQVIVTALTQLVLAVTVAGLTGAIFARTTPQTIVREGNLWNRMLTRNRGGLRPFLAVELTNGRVIEGYLLAVSNNSSPAHRDIALQGPLAETPLGGRRTRSKAAFVIISGSQVRTVTAGFPEPRRRMPTQGGKRHETEHEGRIH